jgi:hypothetical protein
MALSSVNTLIAHWQETVVDLSNGDGNIFLQRHLAAKPPWVYFQEAVTRKQIEKENRNINEILSGN